jgi:hypothetical protein
MGDGGEVDIISSRRSRASVLAARRARHFASVVAYSFFGIAEIMFCNATSLSDVATRFCFMGKRVSSVGTLVLGRVGAVAGYRFRRAWVDKEVRKARDWRICFGFDDWMDWKRSFRFC